MSVKKKFRFYILTTASGRYTDWDNRVAETDCNFKSLKVHFDPRWSNIQYKDAVVVVNTISSSYKRAVKSWCVSKGIECHITDCNNTPGKGKNELLKIFLDSEDDYMVQIDGDDMLTPYGVDLYKNLANQKAPDSIIIYHQWSQQVTKYGQRFFTRIMNNQDRPANYKKDLEFFYKFVPLSAKFQKDYRKKVNSMGGIDKVCHLYATYSNQMHELCRKYNEKYFSHVTNQHMVDNHCRPVWYSRKAAEYRFNEEMRIGEDTRLYLQLKTAHYKGLLNVVRLKEVPCSYVYNNLHGGIVAEESNGMTNMDWMKKFMDYIEEDVKEGKIGEYPNLPELQVSIPEEVNDYYITQEFNIEDLDPTSEEYKNIKICDDTRKELKQRINLLEEQSTQLARKLILSIKPEGAMWGYFKNPYLKNIYLLTPMEHKMEHYFQKRIIL